MAAPMPAPASTGSGVLALDKSMLVADPKLGSGELLAELQPPAPSEGLLGTQATEAAAASVNSLMRALMSDRQHVPVYRGGPTLEDLVREEIRPLLKHWLDANLPPMVERLVRMEIERVVLRAVS